MDSGSEVDGGLNDCDGKPGEYIVWREEDNLKNCKLMVTQANLRPSM